MGVFLFVAARHPHAGAVANRVDEVVGGDPLDGVGHGRVPRPYLGEVGQHPLAQIGLLEQSVDGVADLGRAHAAVCGHHAAALLAKAGYPNGFKVTIDMRTVQPVQGITEALQQTAKRAGIDIQ